MKSIYKSLGAITLGLIIVGHVSAQDTAGAISGDEVNATSCVFISENTVSCTNSTLKDNDNDGYLDESEFRNSDIFEIPGLEEPDATESETKDTLNLGNQDESFKGSSNENIFPENQPKGKNEEESDINP